MLVQRNDVGRVLFTYATLTFFALIFMIPLVYALYTSFLQLKDVDSIVPFRELTVDSYVRLWTSPAYSLPRWYWNTAVMTGIIIGGNLIFNTMAGYALSKLDFYGKRVIFFIILATLMIPYHIVLIPVYTTMATLGWLDTMRALTIPYMSQVLHIFLVRQFFLGVPNELLEASRLDGLSKIGAFFRIMLPLSGPALATMIILIFTGTWNSFMIPSTMVTRKEMFVLVVGLNSVKDQYFDRTNLIMAGVILTTLPVILLFLFLQKWYVQGVSTSGLKG